MHTQVMQLQTPLIVQCYFFFTLWFNLYFRFYYMCCSELDACFTYIDVITNVKQIFLHTPPQPHIPCHYKHSPCHLLCSMSLLFSIYIFSNETNKNKSKPLGEEEGPISFCERELRSQGLLIVLLP